MKSLFIDANRNGYGPDQCNSTMTVGEMIAWLQQFPDEASIFLRHDRGYTYGSITEHDFDYSDYEDE